MDPLAHLMFAPDSVARGDIATDHAVAIVAEGGWAALTPQAIADRCRCSRQAVHQWFGGHEALRRVVARCFSSRWERWTEARMRTSGLAGMLPDSDEVVTWCRVWLALVERAPRDPEVAELVDAIRAHEVRLIGDALGVAEERAVALHCLVEGWRARLVGPGARSAPSISALLDVKQPPERPARPA